MPLGGSQARCDVSQSFGHPARVLMFVLIADAELDASAEAQFIVDTLRDCPPCSRPQAWLARPRYVSVRILV